MSICKVLVKYLGFEIERNTIKPLKSNTEAIERLTPPQNVKDLRGFLGKINYYHKFLPNRSVLLYPLHQLLRKDKVWEWDEECQKAFEEIKGILTTTPIMRIFNPKNNTYLYTDASKKGIGAILKQSTYEDPTVKYVVGYFSTTLADYQRNYTVTELELLAIVSAVEYWHYYLIATFFTIYTDHQPLKSVNKLIKQCSRLFNWALKLSQYRFKVEYCKGSDNQEADYLSRHPVEQLQELVKQQVFWVDIAEIQAAQNESNLDLLPKRVKVIGKGNEKQLCYFKKDQKKSYIPEKLATRVLEKLHLEKGHLGKKQMEIQFTRIYYQPELSIITRKIVENCDLCSRVKDTRIYYGTLGQVGPIENSFDVVHIDTKSGFCKYGSLKDNLHIAIDAFTRYVWIITSRTKRAVDYVNLLQKLISIQKPKKLVTDNYPSLRRGEFVKFLENNDIEHILIAPNHPASNGIVERVNKTLMERLKIKVLENPKIAWTTHVKNCVEEYNVTPHSVTKYQPKYLLTGIDEDKIYQEETLNESRKKAKENSERQHDLDIKIYDKKHREYEFHINDLVYVETKHKMNRKPLEPKYQES